MNKIIKALSEWRWSQCIFCGWPLPDGAAVCPKCNNGSNR